MGRFVIPDDAKLAAAKWLGVATYSVNQVFAYKLFKNAHVVTPATTLADLTEADYAGYTPWAFTPADPTLTNGFGGDPTNKANLGPMISEWPPNTGSPQTVYGFYLVYTDSDNAEQMLGACNVFDADPATTLDGRVITDTPPVISTTLRLWDYLEANPIGQLELTAVNIGIGEFTVHVRKLLPGGGVDTASTHQVVLAAWHEGDFSPGTTGYDNLVAGEKDITLGPLTDGRCAIFGCIGPDSGLTADVPNVCGSIQFDVVS